MGGARTRVWRYDIRTDYPLGHGDHEGSDRGGCVVQIGPRCQRRENGEVDRIAGAAYDRKLKQLQPVLRLPGTQVDPAQNLPGRIRGSVGRRRNRHLGGASLIGGRRLAQRLALVGSSPKCRRASSATSEIAH